MIAQSSIFFFIFRIKVHHLRQNIFSLATEIGLLIISLSERDEAFLRNWSGHHSLSLACVRGKTYFDWISEKIDGPEKVGENIDIVFT